MFQVSPDSEDSVSVHLPVKPDQFAGKKAHIDLALYSISGISRTFKGESNVDVSTEKQPLKLKDSELQNRAGSNFRETLELLFSYPDIVLDTPSKVAQLIGVAGLRLNKGLVDAKRSFWRNWETPFDQVPPAQIKPLFRTEFCSEFMRRFNDPDSDPVSFAFWIEKYGNTRLHPLADGCSRLTKALSAWILGRAGLNSAVFENREQYLKILLSPWEQGEKSYRERIAKN